MSEVLNLVIGTVLVPLISVINAKITNDRARYWIAIGICLVVGGIANADKFNVATPVDFLASVGVVVVAAQAVYKKLYENSKVQVKIENTVRSIL